MGNTKNIFTKRIMKSSISFMTVIMIVVSTFATVPKNRKKEWINLKPGEDLRPTKTQYW